MTFAEVKPLVDALSEDEKKKLKEYLAYDTLLYENSESGKRVFGLSKDLIRVPDDFDWTSPLSDQIWEWDDEIELYS